MRQIEAFDILTKSIQKYLHAAQLNGSRNNALLIIAPCDPLNLQPLISEFDQLQNSTPRLEKLFERTGEILDAWNTFVQLPKDGESLCYRIDESYKIWLKSAGIDPEQWSEGSDYLIYTWDGTAHIINEVNGYLRRKIGAKKSTASTSAKSKAGTLTQPQIALMYYYKGETISRDNANSIAAEYGYTAKTSGEGLYQDFTDYSNRTYRLAVNEMTNKVLLNKIARFESIEPYIQDEKNKSVLLAEIQILKSALDSD